MAMDPAFHPWAQCGIGLARFLLHQPEDAIRHLEMAIQLAPTLVNAWNNLGLAREALKDWAGAVTAFEEAARLDPRSAVISVNLRDARKGLARRREQEQARERGKHLKPLHKYLLLAALAGDIFGIVYHYLINHVLYRGDYWAFLDQYSWVVRISVYALEGCLIAGIVGSWLVTGRPRPWLPVVGIFCLFSPYLNLLKAGINA